MKSLYYLVQQHHPRSSPSLVSSQRHDIQQHHAQLNSPHVQSRDDRCICGRSPEHTPMFHLAHGNKWNCKHPFHHLKSRRTPISQQALRAELRYTLVERYGSNLVPNTARIPRVT